MRVLQSIVSALRRFKADHHVQPSVRPAASIATRNDATAKLIAAELNCVRTLSRWGHIEIIVGDAPEAGDASARIVLPEVVIAIPLAGVLDLDAETARLRKEIAVLEAEIGKLDAKLSNESFLAKAPADVVETQRARLSDARQAVEGLTEALQALKTR